MKIKNFFSLTDTQKTEGQTALRRKILQNIYVIKYLYPEYNSYNSI